MQDAAHRGLGHCGQRLSHHYGSNVHLLSDPYTLTLADRLSSPEVEGAGFHRLLEAAFRHLLSQAVEQLPLVQGAWPTRMASKHEGTAWEGPKLDPAAPVVLIDIARGGMLPSWVMQQQLLELLKPSAVRVDHLFMQRISDASGRVTGVDHSGSKIGGPVQGATLILPDPMAATGSSVEQALRVYEGLEGGPPRRVVLCHLIVTPEYLRRITRFFPDAVIYAIRLDRGMSPPDVLATTPGTRWDEERGLDADSYIMPGAGGLGELINNAD